MFSMLLGDTVTKCALAQLKFDLVHQTISPREREGSGEETTGYHAFYRYVYTRECMPIYAKSHKVTITFIRRSKFVV